MQGGRHPLYSVTKQASSASLGRRSPVSTAKRQVGFYILSSVRLTSSFTSTLPRVAWL